MDRHFGRGVRLDNLKGKLMAHFARLDENNVVEKVYCVNNRRLLDGDGNESEEIGIALLQKNNGEDGIYKQTDYHTAGGKHKGGGTQFRKNYCGTGYIYHPSPIDGFSPPKPYESWVLDEETCWWKPPFPMPDTTGPDKHYKWDEATGGWAEVEFTMEEWMTEG